ncbi:Thioesterase/thiol ester dehydrase-isomerase [Obba rivulosa]|uniref:Thioesterase/thiol ester dehydrase-isomerase n=1 Tax=Obba rivulosa TaxID=1052685 RepID=A0A8E2J6Y8_9APHY|nr:Thioesterase/thiol ester dehydrase-isomerase [Obba rivulosa]
MTALSRASALLSSVLCRQSPAGCRGFKTTARIRAENGRIYSSSSSIKSLQDAFRDPSSPFHIPPGTHGPASPDPPSEAELHTSAHDVPIGLPDELLSAHDQSLPSTDAFSASDVPPESPLSGEQNEWGQSPVAETAKAHLLRGGYDPDSFWEQPVVWGDHDAFQHVDNVRYVRFFESSRIKWMRALAREIGGPQRENAILRAQGVGLILKSISVDYKRPVTYPDTLLVAHKVHTGLRAKAPRTHFHFAGAIYSYAQQRVVTTCDSVLVWYDYDKLVKCDPGQKIEKILARRISRKDRLSL